MDDRPIDGDDFTPSLEQGSNEPHQKTPVSLFQELCTAFQLGIPFYNLEEANGEAHQKVFKMSLTVTSLGITEFGEAKTKIQAKHNAANKIMQLIKDASSTNTNLNEIQHDCLVKCNEWLKKFQVVDVDLKNSAVNEKSAGLLTGWALTRDLPLPEYETVSIAGPAHKRIFVMKCIFKEHATFGEGKSKKIAKHIAAEKMLKIVDDGNFEEENSNEETTSS